MMLLISCEKEVSTVKLPEFNQKLAIASFISPSDSVSFVFVSSNRKVYGELGVDEPVGILSGTISDGSNVITLDTTSNGLFFRRDKMPIISGLTYTLKVTSDKSLTAEAVCTVPEQRDSYIQLDTFSIIQEVTGYGSWREFRMTVSFIDYPGEDNFYRIIGKYTGYSTYLNYQDSLESRVRNESLWFEKEFMTDAVTDINGYIQNTASFNSSFNYYDSAFLKIYLLNTEKSYYLYHKSLEDYEGDENPFTEVTPVYSNITGGLGIFTSYTIDSLVFRLK
jgi:hypothetical protein